MKSSFERSLVRPRELVMRLSSSSTGRPSLVSRYFGNVRRKSARPLVEMALRRASSSWIRSTCPIPTFSRIEKPFRNAGSQQTFKNRYLHFSWKRTAICFRSSAGS